MGDEAQAGAGAAEAAVANVTVANDKKTRLKCIVSLHFLGKLGDRVDMN